MNFFKNILKAQRDKQRDELKSRIAENMRTCKMKQYEYPHNLIFDDTELVRIKGRRIKAIGGKV